MTKIAFVFPGQGSQSIGMLSKLSVQYPNVIHTFSEASSVLGYDLWSLVQNGPRVTLNQTWHTQPAILAASVALWRVWKLEAEERDQPEFMAGHSLGEYSALVCSGVISFVDAIRLVEIRGKLMQKSIVEGIGSMLVVIGLDDETIIRVCEETRNKGLMVWPANYNAPGQVVIAGYKEAVNYAKVLCKRIGAKYTISLPISVPSHCELMKPAAMKLASVLRNIIFYPPVIPVINNVDIKCETRSEAIKDALVRQLYSTVQWTKIVNYMILNGVKCFYEIGPGNVLTGFIKRIINSVTVLAINEPDSLSKAIITYRNKKKGIYEF